MITLENGQIQNQGGMFVPNGSISFQLNIDATIIATPFGLIPAQQELVFQFDETGDLVQPAKLYSNAELNPQNGLGLGTYYLVTIYDANGARINKSPMWWQFTEAANSTVDISLMTPFSTVGGNVIFYPTSFEVSPPTPTTLGGIFSNVGTPGSFISAINTDGTVSLATATFNPAGASTNVQINSGGSLYADSGFTYNPSTHNVVVQGTITASAFISAGSIALTSGQTITWNSDTGLSRASAGVIDVGNGLAGNAAGTINAAQYNVAGSQIAFSNIAGSVAVGQIGSVEGTGTKVQLTNAGTTASGDVVTYDGSGNVQDSGTLLTALAPKASPTFTGTISAAAISITGSLGIASGQVIAWNSDTGISRVSAGVLAVGNGTAANASGTINAAVVAATTSLTAGVLIATGSTPTTASGQVGFGTTQGVGNSTPGAVTVPALGTGAGPATPGTIVNWLEIDIAGTKFWLPLAQ